TVDLGQGRSREAVAERGKGRVYLDFLLKIYREVKARGRTMQFWGDIIVKYPELVAELPRDAIALEWGYEADHPFDENSAVFAQSGIPFYVCPGTSTWNSIAGRTDNAMENLRNAAANGLKHGAIGLLNTDWGDRGHWQPLSASYLGFAYGAALGWAYAANEAIDLPAALDHFAFADEAGVMGQLAYDLGNAYAKTGVSIHNTSLLFAGCQLDPANLEKLPDSFKGGELDISKIRAAIAYVEETISRLPETRLGSADAALVRAEFAWAAAMIRHGGLRLLWLLGEPLEDQGELAAEAERLTYEFTEIWRQRNRPGGRADSLARLAKMAAAYE
ncbi:MAG: hypothetical protein KDE34_23135, partial [Anaerolineales bacterium]|nr:hypothetical protein [Anaerolineales bacterium]